MTPIELTDKISVELIRSNASDQQVADAARVSTLGESVTLADRPIAGLIKALMREKHGSPFEHNSFTFRVHMPLAMATEHLRHRIGWSYNGESGRYKVMDPLFYCPPAERPLQQIGKAMDYDMQPGSDFQLAQVPSSFRRVCQEAFAEYEYLLEIGVAKEVARYALPQNLMVTYYTSCNARSLMAFLSLRTASHSATFPSKPQWEIEQVARQYEEHFFAAMPVTWSAFTSHGRVAP